MYNLDTIQRRLDKLNAERAEGGKSETALLFQLDADRYTICNVDNAELIEPVEHRWYDGIVTVNGITLY